jgi:PAS domain S-box-containing protein
VRGGTEFFRRRRTGLDHLPLTPEALAAIQDGVVVLGPERRIIYANRAFESTLGYAPGELTGRHIAVVQVPGDAQAPAARAIDETVSATGTWSGYYQLAHKDGSTAWFDVRVVAIQHPHWGAVRISVQRDATQRRQLQLELERSEARYRSVVEDLTEVIARVSEDGTLLFVNEAHCRLFGMEARELVGRSWRPLAHPDDLAMIERRLGEMS